MAVYQRFAFEVVDPAFSAIPGGPFLTTMQRPPPRRRDAWRPEKVH